MSALGIILSVAGLLIVAAVFLSATVANRRRQQLFGSEETAIPVNLASVNDAVIIAQVGGRISYANDATREWFQLESGEPDLWLLSRMVTPPEALLELFAAEGRASFTLDGREIDAASHRIAMGDTAQFVITMRERPPLPTLDKEERGSTRAVQIVTEIGRTINASLDLQATYEAAFEGISRLIRYDAAQICLWNQERERLRPVARLGPPAFLGAMNQEEEVYGLTDGYTGWLARKRHSLMAEDVSAFTQVASLRRPTDPPYQSYIGVPLNVRNRFIGTLEVTAIDPRRFERDDLAVLEMLSDQIAIAIDNARQYSVQAQRVAELSGLQNISGAISALQDPYKLFAQLGQRVAELMETEMGGVLLYDLEGERLVAQRPLYGVADGITADYVIPLEKGNPARALWEDVDFWFSNDVPNDQLVAAVGLGALVEMAGLVNTAMVAMTVGDERIGVLQVSNRIGGVPFTLEDIRLLQIYADQAAIVVESARLYREEQSRVAELHGLQQIVQTMSALTNPEYIYAQLTRRIAELLGVDICGFLLLDAEEEKLTARTPFYGVGTEIAVRHVIPVDKRGLAREVWREHEYFHSNHVSLDDAIDGPGMRAFARNASLRNTLMAPLSTGGRRFGMLQVGNKADGTDFDDSDKRLVTIFAGQAAALIDNARLYQDTDATLRKRAAELRSVSRISHELNATLELERILEVIATEALRAEGARWGNLAMFDWKAESSEPVRTMEFGTQVGQEAEVLERAILRSGDVLVIDDFEKVAFYPSPLPDARSALLVPIHFENKVVGVIALYSDRPRGLGPSAAEYVQALSSQATIAVTNATRHAEQVERSELLRSRAEQMTRIFELGQMFRSDQSVEENLASVARAITEAASFEVALIHILDREQKELHPISHSGLPISAFREATEHPVSREIVEKFLDPQYQLSGSYLIPHADSGDLFGALRLPRKDNGGPDDAMTHNNRWQSGDLLVVPLKLSTGEFIGILSVDRPRDGMKATRNTVELLEIFGNEAAVVIENRRLYQSVEERAQELSKSLENLSRSYGELDRLSQEMIRKDMELSQANDLLNQRAQRLLALHRVMESVDTSRQPEEVLKDIAASVVQEMGIDQCLIAIARGGEGETIRIAAAEGRLPKDLNFDELITGSDPLSATLEKGEPLIHAPGRSGARSVTARFAKTLEVQTYLALPIQLAADTKGVLMVSSARPGAAFDEEDRDLFTLLASQIVVEYENASLYQAVQSEAATAASERDRLQQLHLITTALQQADQLQMRLGVVARGIRSVGWGRVALMLFGEDMDIAHFVTAGYEDDEVKALREGLPSGKIWAERLTDPRFVANRIGSSYFAGEDGEKKKKSKKQSGANQPWQSGDQLYLPMYAGSRMIGLVNLREPESGLRPTEADMRPLELFVQQAASALENTRLYQETLELQSFTEAVVESIQQGIIVTDSIGTIESLNTYIQEEYGWDASLVGKNLFKAQPFLKKIGVEEKFSRVTTDRQPVEVTNAEYGTGEEVRTINVFMYPRYDEEQDVTGAVVLIEDITQRARLEADIALRGKQLAALSDASRQITSTLSVEDVVRNVLDQAEQVISYGQVSLWRRSENGEEMTIAGARGYSDNEQMVGLSLKIEDDPLFAEIAKEQEAILIGDVREDPRVPEAGIRPARSWLGAPLGSGGKLIGLLVLERPEAHAYAPADAQVAAALANQVAIALENARLFEEAADRADELTDRTQRLALLNRISATLGRSLDQNSILQTTINELTQVLDAPQGCVLLFNQEQDTLELSIQYPSNPDGSVDKLVIPAANNPLVDHAARSTAPVAIRNPQGDPLMSAMQEFVEKRRTAATLIIPFVVGNSTIGLLTVDQIEDGKWFEGGQLELAQTITNQAAISVQNAQLFQETVARRAELGVLFEAGRIASSSLDLDTVVQSAAGYFVRALNADGVTISLWDEHADALRCLIDFAQRKGPRNLTDADHRYGLKDYPAARSVVTERGVATLDVDGPTLSEREREWLERQEIHTALVLPLVARDEAMGLVELYKREAHRFDQREIGLARALAATIATAMENARLHDVTQQRLEELGHINEISRALTQTISPEDLYQILQDQVQSLIHAHSITLAETDPVSGKLTFPLAVRGGLRIHVEPIGYGADLYSYAIEPGEPPLIARDVAGKTAKPGVDHTEPGLKSFLGVPLVSGEKVLGVLAVEDYEHENAFTETHLRVLSPIAAQVAVSKENTRLYRELEQRLSETTTLQEVSRVVNSALDLREIFERVVSELANAFHYPVIDLYTLDFEGLHLRAWHGLTDDEVWKLRDLPIDSGIAGRAARTGKVQFVQDVTRDEDYVTVKPWVRSIISVPIISDNDVLGVLSVQSGLERPLGENDEQLLRTFAGQVATAMANASLYAQMVKLSAELEQRVEDRTRQLREERDRIDTLYKIAVELTASLDLDRVLNRALELVGEAVGADSGSLFLLDPHSDRLIWRAQMRGNQILPPGAKGWLAG